jgi:hypothetical protein
MPRPRPASPPSFSGTVAVLLRSYAALLRSKTDRRLAVGTLLAAPAAAAAAFLFFRRGGRNAGAPLFSNLNVFRSLGYALFSPRLRNMVIVTGLLSMTLGRGFGGGGGGSRRAPAIFAVVWLAWYLVRVRETPDVRCLWTQWNMQLVEKARLTHTAFSPVFWMVCSRVVGLSCIPNRTVSGFTHSYI